LGGENSPDFSRGGFRGIIPQYKQVFIFKGSKLNPVFYSDSRRNLHLITPVFFDRRYKG